MYQAGIQNVVSSSGTSLTKDQIKLIRRYTQNITILYDGDPAGIKASFRGIDLILEEGMNVKVVLFPEGEDPDSFSKKSSTVELENYIKESTQDFISFKASILLKDSENDPIKRAELIKEIVHSVSLIPDQITRTIYMQQISQQFEINEQVISNELIKLRKNIVVKQAPEPDFYDIPKTQEQQLQQNSEPQVQQDVSYCNEEQLIRIMVKYGTRTMQFDQIDENDQTNLSETNVIEFICHELITDEMTFTHPVYNKIHSLFLDGLSKNEFLSINFLKRLEDQDIVKFVSDIESNEHELSANWLSNYNIVTRSEGDRMTETVMNAIYSFKLAKIEQHINDIRIKMGQSETLTDELLMDLLAEQMVYEKIKIIFSEKLGRTILR